MAAARMKRGLRLIRTGVGLFIVGLIVFAITLQRPPVFDGLTILNIIAFALAFIAAAKGLRLCDEARNESTHGR